MTFSSASFSEETFSQSTGVPNITINLSGVSGIFLTGFLLPKGFVEFEITGVSVDANTGDIVAGIATTFTLTGQSAFFNTGSVVVLPKMEVQISGVNATYNDGSISAESSITVDFDGVGFISETGTLTVKGSSQVAIAGTSAAYNVGSVVPTGTARINLDASNVNATFNTGDYSVTGTANVNITAMSPNQTPTFEDFTYPYFVQGGTFANPGCVYMYVTDFYEYITDVDTNDPSTYARFSITGSSTDASGYNKLAVTHLVSNNTYSSVDDLIKDALNYK